VRVRGLYPEKARYWPTPQAHDAIRGYAHRIDRYGTAHGGRNLNDAATYAEGQDTGLLNPAWVEWLQGFPAGWTDLSP
jgi:hypothetical protein